MKKILNYALVFSMALSSATLYAQGAPANSAPQDAPAAPPAQSGAATPAVSGDLQGMNGAPGLSTGAKVAIGLGVLAVAAAAGGGGGGGGSSGSTGTR